MTSAGNPGVCGKAQQAARADRQSEGIVMGLSTHGGTMPGAITPICNECGTFLCWDLGEEEAERDRMFWDSWVCQDCNGGERMSLQRWRIDRAKEPT
jgi:hypothetical protein